jgi:hypothetical protein
MAWFVIMFLIILSILLIIIYISKGFQKTYDCPYCSTKNKNFFQKKYILSRYKFITKSGQPDKRYKNNPKIYRFEVYISCKKCAKVFTGLMESLKLDLDFSKPIEQIKASIVINLDSELKVLEQEKLLRKSVGLSTSSFLTSSFLNLSESQLDNKIAELKYKINENNTLNTL